MKIADAREEVLRQVRQASKSALLPSARAAVPPRDAAPHAEPAELVEEFAHEVDALGVKMYRPSTAAEARDIVVRLVRMADTNLGAGVKLLAWADSEIPLEGVGEALAAAGIERLDADVPADPERRRDRLAELEQATVGLTGALAALADSGTLVLLGGSTRPRLASLLPPVHIAVLAKSRIYATMADLFSALPTVVRQASNLVFITGASRSADIEQTLTLGVHGPRHVHVVLVGAFN